MLKARPGSVAMQAQCLMVRNKREKKALQSLVIARKQPGRFPGLKLCAAESSLSACQSREVLMLSTRLGLGAGVAATPPEAGRLSIVAPTTHANKHGEDTTGPVSPQVDVRRCRATRMFFCSTIAEETMKHLGYVLMNCL